MAAHRKSLPYRPCVGILLFNADAMVLVGERGDTTGAWQMPQGGIEPGEAPATAALRELKEEVGTDHAELVAETRAWYRYDLPAHLVGKVWHGRWRGQEQKWFAAHFLGDDADISIHTAHPEFIGWRWVALDQLVPVVVPFKRDVDTAVVGELGPAVREHVRRLGA